MPSDQNKYHALVQWRNKKPLGSGVIVACDANLQWILPWWWYHYSKHNTLPVIFVDLGMSSSAKEWCQQHGQVLAYDIPMDFVALQDKIESSKADLWTSIYQMKGFWKIREQWFKKPLSLLFTPFERTLWVDLDCEIRDSIDPIFAYGEKPFGFGIAEEPLYVIEKQVKLGLTNPGTKLYNSGVIVFRHGADIILKWAHAVIDRNRDVPGDSDLLTDLIQQERLDITVLPQIYNWRMAQGENPSAKIIHWVADWGKEKIRQELLTIPDNSL